jgi:hypothetical protein
MAIDTKVTDLQERVVASEGSWMHFVDPDDVSQSADGSSYKIKKINLLKEIVADVIKSAPFLGAITPTSTHTATTTAYWLATQAGTYTNFGGVVVAANSFAVISRDAAGVFSISQTALDISSKVNVSDVQTTVLSTNTTNPVTGKAVNDFVRDNYESIENTVYTKTIASGQANETASVLLKTGNTIKYKTSGATSGASIAVFLIRANGTNLYIGLGLETFKEYTFLEDFASVKFYNNTNSLGFTATYEVLSLSKKIIEIDTKAIDNANAIAKVNTIFESSAKKPKTIVWKNAGGYWSSNNMTVNASYDISEPIATNGFKYFGLYGVPNDNFWITEVDVSGIRIKAIEKGLLPYYNTGRTLTIFKTTASYFSISTENSQKAGYELYELKSPAMIKMLDHIDATATNFIATNALAQSASNKADSASAQLTNTIFTGVATVGGSLEVITYSTLLKAGTKIKYYLSANATGGNLGFYWYRADGTYVTLSGLSETLKEYTLLEDFVYFKSYANNTAGYTYKVELLSKISVLENAISLPLVRALIIGDSYSQNGGQWAGEMISKFRGGSSYISLAVSSATLRDKQTDRVTYPYTSRPVSSNNTGNLNTISCQIQKLKRLMAGTDLDGGETKIYETVASHPNVIIIEGGMNDNFDIQSVEDTYTAQFSKQVNNVYYKQTGGSNILGTFYIKTPIAEVNRTCFAGSYRYLVEELSLLFPDAQIFITLSSGLGYWTDNVVDKRIRTANQQKKCAQLCSASIIDWNGEGNINSIVNYPTGSGTEVDPYVLNQTVGSIDTNDAMHPNARGGKKYGRVAALVIKSKYINFNNE